MLAGADRAPAVVLQQLLPTSLHSLSGELAPAEIPDTQNSYILASSTPITKRLWQERWAAAAAGQTRFDQRWRGFCGPCLRCAPR